MMMARITRTTESVLGRVKKMSKRVEQRDPALNTFYSTRFWILFIHLDVQIVLLG